MGFHRRSTAIDGGELNNYKLESENKYSERVHTDLNHNSLDTQ